MLDHSAICALAKQVKRLTKDLIAMTPNNDPFYADQRGRRRNAEWFGEQWRRFDFPKGVHIRRIHYVLVSQLRKKPR